MSPPPVFNPTRWSLITAARSGDAPRVKDALEALCSSYWYPLYAYVRRCGHPPEDSADLTQDFFAQLVEKELLIRADPERGRLRNFLLTALQRFLHNDWRRSQRQKRGGGTTILSIDEAIAEGLYAREPVDHVTPEVLYHRRWALTLLERALVSLRDSYERLGKVRAFDILKSALTGDPDIQGAAGRLGMTEGAVRVSISRLRTRYRARLLEEVAASMDARSAAEVDEEISALFRAVQ